MDRDAYLSRTVRAPVDRGNRKILMPIQAIVGNTEVAPMMRERTAAFLLWLCATVAFSWSFLNGFMKASLERGYSSHVVLIPFLTAYLIWSGRTKIFAEAKSSLRTGLPVALAGVLGFILASHVVPFAHGAAQVVKLIAVFLLVIGGFITLYGAPAFKRAAFRFVLLLLMLPLPSIFIRKAIDFLQAGSTELAYGLFSLLGVPVHRDGFLLYLPGLTIEVAKECSGINSSVALLITALLIACETLRTTSRRVILVLFSIPLSLVKNAVRIVTLTMLSVYVDRSFLTGPLHRDGGIVFYLLTLAMMYPVWRILRKTEQKRDATTAPEKLTRLSQASGAVEG
jgi:exosortase